MEVGSIICTLLLGSFFLGAGFQDSEDWGRRTLPSFPPKAPIHFNTGAWPLALPADEGCAERWTLLSDIGDYECIS